MQKPTLRATVAVLLLAAAVAGCGGGGGGGGTASTPPPADTGTDVPASALASIEALIAFLQQLIASSSETGLPIRLGDIVLPTNDTATPTGI